MGGKAAGMLLSIDDLNRMAVSDFTASFGDVAEHSPWIAERAAGARPFADQEAVIDAFAAALRGARAGRATGRAARASGSRRPGGGHRRVD